MPTNAYLPFDLLVEKQGDNYRARVLDSPVGQASAQFAPPFDAPELAQFLAYVGLRAPIAGTHLKPEELLKRTGTRLFDAVFRDEVLTSYRRSRDAAERENKGLRVKLRLNDVPDLADLPWEYIYDSTRQQFLALSKDTSIVRYLELPEPVAPLAAPAPLNLLALAAGPSDYPELDVEGEWARLNTAVEPLRAAKRITLTRVEPPTLDALRAQLRKNDYHIFHFIGHGEYDESSGQGALVFQDESGEGRAVNDERIATLLHDVNSMRFILLNACEGARVSGKNPFTGVASRLVQQGIPAVIAMQFPISDPAAIRFSTDIYATLADGYPVDAAVNEARRAIYFNGSVLEWGTPVLFMRADDGMIFQDKRPPSPAGRGVLSQDADAARQSVGLAKQGGEGIEGEGIDSKEKPMEESENQKKGSTHGGINITGNAKVSVGRDIVSGDKIVQGDDNYVQGDMNVANIGAGAQVGQFAQGRIITQTSGSAANKQELAQKLKDVQRALEGMRAQLDESKYELAEIQLNTLSEELTRTDRPPNGERITKAGNSLMRDVPLIGGFLGIALQTAAAQKVLAETGTLEWSRTKFG